MSHFQDGMQGVSKEDIKESPKREEKENEGLDRLRWEKESKKKKKTENKERRGHFRE